MQVVFGSGNNNPREPYSIEYLNVVREMRDLVWTEEQIDLMIDPPRRDCRSPGVGRPGSLDCGSRRESNFAGFGDGDE